MFIAIINHVYLVSLTNVDYTIICMEIEENYEVDNLIIILDLWLCGKFYCCYLYCYNDRYIFQNNVLV